jgi:hypothetical protein
MTINHSSVKGKEMDALRDKSITQGISRIEGVGSSSPSRLEQPLASLFRTSRWRNALAGHQLFAATPRAASDGSPQQDRFDITILGFQVKAQAWDDALQTDSKGDEVFVDYVVQLGDASGKNQVSVHNQTDVMGDVNRQEGRE